MASRGKNVATVAKKTDLVALEAQLAEEAANAISTAISKPTGKKISVKNKQFVLPDGTVLGNSMDIVVLDFISMNRFYLEVFNPNNPRPPACFAMGKDLQAMAPHDESPEKQTEGTCARCPMNQWESDPQGGKGKACKNTRELAVVLASDIDDPEAEIYSMSVSPTGIRSFDAMVAYVARTFNGPLIKAIVNVSLNPNTEYPQLVFGDAAPNESYAELLARRQEATDMLFVPPDVSNFHAAAPAPRSRAAAPTTKRGTTRGR